MNNLQKHPHKRLNILTNEWVLVSPHRNKRPWQGSEEEIQKKDSISYDPSCYLCPGNKRSNGKKNPNYEDVYVFDNDFAALNLNHSNQKVEQGLLQAQIEQGICRVICFSPDHSKSLADMEINEIVKVITLWIDQYQELSDYPEINHVQIFENKGSAMGCSNPHPHGQIWSQSSIPNEVLKKDFQQKKYFQGKNRSLLLDYVNQELQNDVRIIFENDNFVLLVPFWAVWPYETMIIPKNHQTHIGKMDSQQIKSYAEAISMVTKMYDKVFNCAFPYSSGIHQMPTDKVDRSYWHWHMTFYPPLLRSATVKKFMVGYEMFGMPQRDITAETVAHQLKKIIYEI